MKKLLVCFKCKQKFAEALELRRHAALDHPGKGAYGCVHCAKRYALWRDVLDHRKTCSQARRLTCGDCGEAEFETPREAVVHDHRVHGKGAPLDCPHCDRVFVLHKGLLTFLHKTHAALATFPCRPCRVDFQTAGMLAEHERSKHAADPEAND